MACLRAGIHSGGRLSILRERHRCEWARKTRRTSEEGGTSAKSLSLASSAEAKMRDRDKGQGAERVKRASKAWALERLLPW